MEEACRITLHRSQMVDWLSKRNKPLPTIELSEQQKMEISQCFELIDEDGSQRLEADELAAAFKMLGIKVAVSN